MAAAKAEIKHPQRTSFQGLYKSVPPLQEMFNMAGMELPEFLKGKNT